MAGRLSKYSIILGFCFSILACHRHSAPESLAPVLVVNGENLTAADFAQRLGKKLKSFDALAAKDPTNVKRSKEMILKDFVVSALLRQFAAAQKATVSEAEFDAEFNHIRKSYPDDLTFKASLADEGNTLENWKAKLRLTLLEKKAFALIGPSDLDPDILEEVKDYYATHKNEFPRPAEIHIKQIVVAKKDDAERLLKSIKKGTSFDEIAKKYSISPDASKGGDIGYVAKGVVSVFDAAFNYKIGQLSPVVQSSYGFHIIKVIDKRNAVLLSFEQAKERILKIVMSQKQQEAFSEWLENSIKNSKIERNESLINKISVRTEGNQE